MSKFKIIFSLIIIALIVVWLLLPGYLKKALVYQKPDIDDYTLFENRVIETGIYQPWKLSNRYNQTKIDSITRLQFENYKTTSFVVVQNDSLLYEEYWDGYSDTSLSNSFSMAKSIVSLLACIAIDEGKIDSACQYVSDFLPEYKNGLKAKVRIVDLLTMSSGLDWDEAYSSATSITTRSYYGEELKQLVLNQDVVTEPGKLHQYQSGTTQLLALVVEKATGNTVSEYASEKLWKKIGARVPALWSLDHPGGVEKTYCCFNSNAPDFARIGQLILQKGRWNNQQIVSDSILQLALAPAKHLTDDEENPVDYYGWQWWMVNYKGMDIKFARGIKGQYIFIIPAHQIVIVRLGHQRSNQFQNNYPTDVFLWIDTGLNLAGC